MKWRSLDEFQPATGSRPLREIYAERKQLIARYVPADIQRPLPVGYYGHLHNIYIQYAAERGIPALLFMLWLIAMTVFDCLRGIRRAGRARSQELFVLHGTIAVIIGILVGGLFEHNLGDSEVLMMFLSVVALGYAALYNLAIIKRDGIVNTQSH